MASGNTLQAGMSGPQQVVGGGTSNWIGDLAGLTNLAGGIYGLVNSSNLNSSAQTVFNQSNPFGAYRPQFAQQLVSLMQDPSSVTSLPGYQFQLDQGVQAINRGAAGPGGTGRGSGAEAAALDQYGQGLASSFYNNQINTLAQLAGANISPANPFNALQGLGGAATSTGQSIAGLSSGLSGTLNLLSKLFPGSSNSGTDLDQFYGPNNPDAVTGTPIDLQNLNSIYTGDTSGGGTTITDSPSGTTTTFDDSSAPDLSSMWTNPSAAGGEAAGSGHSALGTIGQVGGIGLNLAQGTPTGYTSAVLSGASLASRYPSNINLTSAQGKALGTAAGEGADILGIYEGVKQGGGVGYTEAAANAAKLGAATGELPGVVGTAAGYVAAPLSVYEFAKNWQSGNTGSDALSGAEAGASFGSIIPGIGTVIGAVIGGAAGALSSAFGGGRADPETQNLNSIAPQINKNPALASSLSPAQSYQILAGAMDAKNNTVGHSPPIEQVFGRMGEQNMMVQMTQQINSAVKSGQIQPNASASDIYSKIVAPWLQSKGAAIDPNNPEYITSSGSNYASSLQGAIMNLIQGWQSGTINGSTPLGVNGQPIAGLPTFGG